MCFRIDSCVVFSLYHLGSEEMFYDTLNVLIGGEKSFNVSLN